jgi:hypothetical protein
MHRTIMKKRNYLPVFLLIFFCIGWFALAIRAFVKSSLPAPDPDCVKIYGEDIPDYPTAQNLVKNGPIKDWRETYTWSFETTDAPEKVWNFYVDALSEQWEGEDRSWEKTPEKKELHLGKACLFTYIIMTSQPIDESKYEILIQLFSEPGM